MTEPTTAPTTGATITLDQDELRLIEGMTRFWLGGRRHESMRFRLSALKAKVQSARSATPATRVLDAADVAAIGLVLEQYKFYGPEPHPDSPMTAALARIARIIAADAARTEGNR